VLGLITLVFSSVFVDSLFWSGRLQKLTNTSVKGKVSLRAYVARPTEGGPHPGLVLAHEWNGVSKALVKTADLLAKEGYVVIVPDLLDGRQSNWLPSNLYAVLSVSEAKAAPAMSTATTWLGKQTDVDPTKIGVVGFSFGGGVALHEGATNKQIAATAMFYGYPPSDPEKFRGMNPVMAVYAQKDGSIKPAAVSSFDQVLAAANVKHQSFTYPDVDHSFMSNTSAFTQPGPTADAWTDLLNFLSEHLAPSSKPKETP
jgi:carboxymethylenebutenolidase